MILFEGYDVKSSSIYCCNYFAFSFRASCFYFFGSFYLEWAFIGFENSTFFGPWFLPFGVCIDTVLLLIMVGCFTGFPRGLYSTIGVRGVVLLTLSVLA